ncbi:MAG TPA: S1 RNA-binding domain-containing protein, partial [Spirochaetota bacterium]|nr:S1 RNA-binding domain-containing protein [Spirochaetota bacterium]
VMKMAEDAGVNLNDLIASPDLISRIDKKKYSSAGTYTLDDILKELSKPGRDPRKQYSYADFNSSVRTLDDLREGMILSGVVTNVTAFGAFVDIGVHQDGLIHISNLSDKFISNISEAVKVGENLMTEVISVDKELKRISLRRKTDG